MYIYIYMSPNGSLNRKKNGLISGVVVASSLKSWTAKGLLKCAESFLHCQQDVTGILCDCSASEISEQEVRTIFAPIHFNAFRGEVNLGLLSDPN